MESCSSGAEKCWMQVNEFSSFSGSAKAKSISYGPDSRLLKSMPFWTNWWAASSKSKNSSISSMVVIHQKGVGRMRQAGSRGTTHSTVVGVWMENQRKGVSEEG
jgi:hypothetical protein